MSIASTEFNALRREIDGLEAVEGQIARSLEAMQLRKVRLAILQSLPTNGRLILCGLARNDKTSLEHFEAGSSTSSRTSSLRIVLLELSSYVSMKRAWSPSTDSASLSQCLTSVFFPPLATGRVAHDSLTGEAVKRKGNTNGDWISFFIAWGLSQLPNGFVDVNRASRAIS